MGNNALGGDVVLVEAEMSRGDGERPDGLPRAAAEGRPARTPGRPAAVADVPTAGTYVGRRSPRAVEMIRLLGRRDFNDGDPAVQIGALRGIAGDLSSPSWEQLGDAVARYLDLVEATIQLRAGEPSP
jgi:hypothetical protein